VDEPFFPVIDILPVREQISGRKRYLVQVLL
jgi:hypothetical protein